MTPLPDSERNVILDTLRGVALLGVLWVNLLTMFRISLFEHILNFHTHQGRLDEWIDLLTAWLIEFKAFTVFSLLFGVGISIQWERMASRRSESTPFMLRRFLILLCLGLGHMFLIWDGDILCLYALCGILLIPFVHMRATILAVVGGVVMALSFLPVSSVFIPAPEIMRAHAEASTLVYAHGTFRQVLALRAQETFGFILPLLINALPRTLGLMMLGIATWRFGILKHPTQHRVLLVGLSGGLTALGSLFTSMILWFSLNGKKLPVNSSLAEACSYVPLALGMTAGLTLWLSYSGTGRIMRLFAAAGQMALTNYLIQSIVLSLIFYGFGMGLFGQMAPAPALAIVVLLFALQLTFSRAWLRRYRFGPTEWLWRSLTYQCRQSMKRTL